MDVLIATFILQKFKVFLFLIILIILIPNLSKLSLHKVIFFRVYKLFTFTKTLNIQMLPSPTRSFFAKVQSCIFWCKWVMLLMFLGKTKSRPFIGFKQYLHFVETDSLTLWTPVSSIVKIIWPSYGKPLQMETNKNSDIVWTKYVVSNFVDPQNNLSQILYDPTFC